MKLKIDVLSVDWWFWTVTLAFIVAALSGWTPGYTAVIVVSLVQTVFIGVRTGSATSFPSQVRIAYFAHNCSASGVLVASIATHFLPLVRLW